MAVRRASSTDDVDSLREMSAADQPITEPPTTSADPVSNATRVLNLIADL